MIHPGLRVRRVFLQVLIHLSGRDGTFTNCGGDPLDRAVTDIAGCEYTGHARLELKWSAGQGPVRRWVALVKKVASSENEALFVAADRGRDPVRMRHGADEHYQRCGG